MSCTRRTRGAPRAPEILAALRALGGSGSAPDVARLLPEMSQRAVRYNLDAMVRGGRLELDSPTPAAGRTGRPPRCYRIARAQTERPPSWYGREDG